MEDFSIYLVTSIADKVILANNTSTRNSTKKILKLSSLNGFLLYQPIKICMYGFSRDGFHGLFYRRGPHSVCLLVCCLIKTTISMLFMSEKIHLA